MASMLEHLGKFAKRGSGYRKAVPACPIITTALMAGDSMRIDGRSGRSSSAMATPRNMWRFTVSNSAC